jgi:hypothetical protein
MRKLKLDVEQLEVESFAVADGSPAGGSVRAFLNQDFYSDDCGGGGGDGGGATGASSPVCVGPTYCCNPTANTGCCPAPTWQETCPYSCRGSCGATCPYSCERAQCIP